VKVAAQHPEGERVGPGQDVKERLLFHRIALQPGDIAAGHPQSAALVEAHPADSPPTLPNQAAVAARDTSHRAIGEGLDQGPFHGAGVEVVSESIRHPNAVGLGFSRTRRRETVMLSSAELHRRADRAIASLAECRACPRDCGVNRLEDKWAACKTGRYAIVSSHFPHFGEEDCLRGWRGSGTIFFGHCNLRCVFCQNYDISQAIRPGSGGQGHGAGGHRPETIAAMMLELQDHGCHNINFVTPEHVVPQVIEAVAAAVDRGLALPIVYNTSAYDALESIQLMDGIVDIYMPDFKYWSPERSRTYLKAENYAEAACAAIEAMHRQVGFLVVDADGLAKRGLIVRHLVMPGALEETKAILQWIVDRLGRDTYVNLMDQYYPAGKVGPAQYPELNRRLTSREFNEARGIARDLGLRRLDVRRPHPELARRIAGW
jgi:putative pyruvate formate lyase activating enzyme